MIIVILTLLYSRVGRINGAINILVAMGFREAEGGCLVLPLDANIDELNARRLELEVGLDLIRKRINTIEKMKQSTATASSNEKSEEKTLRKTTKT